jgi:hypothetical protein
MRNNTHLVIVSSQPRFVFLVFLLAGPLVLASGRAGGAEARVTEIRTQKIGETVYFEATLQAPDDLRMPKREGENPPTEILRRTLAAQPHLVQLDGTVAAVYFLPPPTEPNSLIFLGKVRSDEPAHLRLLYPTGTTAAAVNGSLLEQYLRAPTWGETTVTLDFSKARRLDQPGSGQVPNRSSSAVDLQSRWAQAQEHELAAGEMQAPDFGFYRFACQATARKYQVQTIERRESRAPSIEEGYKHLYELTTGGSTLAEALAQQRMRSDKVTSKPRTRDIHNLPQIALPAHPWERMIGDRVPVPEPLAHWIPEDNYFATAHGVRAYLDLTQLLDQWGGNVLHAFELTSRDEQVRVRYEKQLCLPAELLSKKVGFTLVRDLAITGSDLYWREGSDVSVLFHVTDSKRFLETVDPFLQDARKEFGAKLAASQSKHRGATIESYVTALREISLHRTAVENVVIYSNSLAALHRILDIRDDPSHSLWRAEDFRYMRTVFRRDEKNEDGFAFLSDAFIRKLLSPASKIKEQRRLQALASLRLAHHAALFHAWETGRLPANQKELLAQSALDGAALRDPEGEEVT